MDAAWYYQNMTSNDFKKLLDEALKPLEQGQAQLRKDLEEVHVKLDGHTEQVNALREDLQEVKDIQEKRVLPPLIYVETTVKSYADRYVTNEDHIIRIHKRLRTVETKMGIHPPEDLLVPLFD